MTGRHRFPQSVYGTGAEPDPRFTLANERTYLAWIRTSVGLLAAGVALEVLGLGMNEGLRLAASLVLISAGMATPLFGWFSWMSIERALRHSRPLPSTALALPVGIVVGIAGALVLLGILLP